MTEQDLEQHFEDTIARTSRIEPRDWSSDVCSSDHTVTLTCKQISPRAGDYGEVRWDTELTKQGGAVVDRKSVV